MTSVLDACLASAASIQASPDPGGLARLILCAGFNRESSSDDGGLSIMDMADRFGETKIIKSLDDKRLDEQL